MATSPLFLADPLHHEAPSLDTGVVVACCTPNEVVVTTQELVLPNKLETECAVQAIQLLAVASILPAVVAITTQHNAIESLFQTYRVPLLDNDLNVTLESLDRLIGALEQDHPSVGMAPGFATRYQENWTPSSKFPYETMGLSTIPTLSTDFCLQCCYRIQKVLVERQNFLCGRLPNACRCLSDWDFVPGNVAAALVNFAVENYMTEEVSSFCNQRVDPTEWDTECYRNSSLIPSNNGVQLQPNNSIRLLRNRDFYLETLVKLAVGARTCISLATTYIHVGDPAVRYVLLDLLPSCIRRQNIKVRLLVDLMTVEGKLVQSAFKSMGGAAAKKKGLTTVDAITSDSFLQQLPKDAPAFELAAENPTSPLAFYHQLFHLASSIGNDRFQIQFWCARDKQERFRIKNHAKCFIVDDQIAIFGGSNVCPTVTAATNEVDLLVSGPVAEKVVGSFTSIWSEMSTGSKELEIGDEPPHNPLLTQFVNEMEWSDVCPAAILQSSPSSHGEDLVLYQAMAAIRTAKSSILMCFGHCNVPRAIARSLFEATQRGVRVQIIVNSMYSNDLRTDQRDLFLSIENLLVNAPEVEIYTTAIVDGKRPPFIHAKYVTIDGQWTLVGSWNMWTRSAFFELEMESFIESPKIARELEEKFEQEKTAFCTRINSLHECRSFGPSGCSVCSCFGSFYPENIGHTTPNLVAGE